MAELTGISSVHGVPGELLSVRFGSLADPFIDIRFGNSGDLERLGTCNSPNDKALAVAIGAATQDRASG